MTVDGFRNVSTQISQSQSTQHTQVQTHTPKNVALEANKVTTKKQEVQQNTSQQTQKKVDEEKIIEAIEKANKSIDMYNRRLEFSIHDATKEIMVKVIDTQTDEIIKEIPSEKILDMVAKLWDLAGILIDEKA